MGVIFGLSSLPGSQIPQVPIPHIDKAAHFFEYSILGALLIRAFVHSRPPASVAKLFVLALTVALLFGISDEWHQTFVPGRSSEWGEVLLDTIFAAAGIVLFWTRWRKAGGRRLS